MIYDLDYYVNNLKILYEDNHLLVIEKPENVLSQKDASLDFDINDICKLYLKNKYNKPGNVYLGLIHRLDRRVGGVMVLAKTSKAASRLSECIRLKDGFDKYYVACIEGQLEESGSISIKIKKEANRASISEDGKLANLDYEYINYLNGISYMNIHLYSGRYNQIRLSFSSIGHPLVGDTKYGGTNNDRIGLWCYKIRFMHPIKKEIIEIVDYPNGDIWNGLKKQ